MLGAARGAGNSRPAGLPSGPEKPRRRPVQARSAALVEAVLEAAARVFDAKGYEAATTNEVAELAGVGIGSLYQYFPNKASLVTALHERHVAEVADAALSALDGADALPEEETVRRLVERVLEVHRRRPGLQRVLHERMPQLAYPEPESEAGQRFLATLCRWLKARRPGLEAAERSARTLLRMGEALVHAAVLAPGGPRDADAGEIVRALAGYLGAGQASSEPAMTHMVAPTPASSTRQAAGRAKRGRSSRAP